MEKNTTTLISGVSVAAALLLLVWLLGRVFRDKR